MNTLKERDEYNNKNKMVKDSKSKKDSDLKQKQAKIVTLMDKKKDLNQKLKLLTEKNEKTLLDLESSRHQLRTIKSNVENMN